MTAVVSIEDGPEVSQLISCQVVPRNHPPPQRRHHLKHPPSSNPRPRPSYSRAPALLKAVNQSWHSMYHGHESIRSGSESIMAVNPSCLLSAVIASAATGPRADMAVVGWGGVRGRRACGEQERVRALRGAADCQHASTHHVSRAGTSRTAPGRIEPTASAPRPAVCARWRCAMCSRARRP